MSKHSKRAVAAAAKGMPPQARNTRNIGRGVITIIAELLLTFAAICGLYIAWMEWWTGVESEHAQLQSQQSVNWTQPDSGGTLSIAQPQQGDPIVQPESAQVGEIIARVYIPRFGQQWERTLVQGTSLEQLNMLGLGHYVSSQMPGAVGNFAIAGHRNGYGQPLGDVDKLQPGDPIVIRSKDYWYVYTYTSHKIVLPDDSSVIGPNPLNPGAEPTKRMITMTTCEPKYSAATHRWISFGELKYWAKVADGIPKELASTGTDGQVKFIANERKSFAAHISSLQPMFLTVIIAYAIIFIAAAIAWRWPKLRQIRAGEARVPDLSIYGGLLRHQPGPAVIRWTLLLLLIVAAVLAMFEWVFPWACSTIPVLRDMANYVAVP